MRDLDGRADTIKRDPTFLSEHRITEKHLADRVFGDTARQVGRAWRSQWGGTGPNLGSDHVPQRILLGGVGAAEPGSCRCRL